MDDPLIFKVLATTTLMVTSVFIPLFWAEPWRRNWYGVSVMWMAVGLWLFALAAVLRQWLGLEYSLRQEIRIAAQGFVLFAMAERTWELVVIKWRRARKKRREREQPEAPVEPDPIGPNGTLHPPRRRPDRQH